MIVVGGLLSVSESFCAHILNVSLRGQVPIIFSEGVPADFRSVSTILLDETKGQSVLIFTFLQWQNSNTNTKLICGKKNHWQQQAREKQMQKKKGMLPSLMLRDASTWLMIRHCDCVFVQSNQSCCDHFSFSIWFYMFTAVRRFHFHVYLFPKVPLSCLSNLLNIFPKRLFSSLLTIVFPLILTPQSCCVSQIVTLP